MAQFSLVKPILNVNSGLVEKQIRGINKNKE